MLIRDESVYQIVDTKSTEPTGRKLIFRTAKDFSQFIESEAVRTKQTCMKTILDYCELREVDVEGIGKMITRSLKGKIKQEMQDEGMLPKESTLEFE